MSKHTVQLPDGFEIDLDNVTVTDTITTDNTAVPPLWDTTTTDGIYEPFSPYNHTYSYQEEIKALKEEIKELKKIIEEHILLGHGE